ncbi:ABC transporter substrate-binding protein [Devosia rhodophyticola]|uniref:Thiamine pyrimidine synthase n=1 Tax=Devosia rhodophyticola TaxID=3026423 RepID=A0ABY7YTH6_9HYPH|nr:ABC transporter substrate-binding protein [Devosia rhodophyticola]WDR04643.1 ABC transporter substrate-binding protein [Devosia rhodophyticola]
MKLRFKLNYLYQGQNAPFLYAVDAGLYARHGIEIAFIEGFSSSLVTKAIAAGEADCGFGDLSSLMTHAITSGSPSIQAVMPIYQRSPCALGYLAPGRPLELADIAGKVLCGPNGDTSARLLPLLLQRNGLGDLQYEMRWVQPHERDAMIASRAAFAATCFDATLKFAMTMRGHDSSKVRFLYFADHGLDIYTGSLVCRADLLEANAGLLDALRSATTQAWHDCRANPDLGVASVLARAPHLDPVLIRQQLSWVIDRQVLPDGPTPLVFDRNGDQMLTTLECATMARDDLGSYSASELIAAVCAA